MTIEEFNKQLGTSYPSFQDVRCDNFSKNPKLTENVIREFQDNVNCDSIDQYQKPIY